MMKNRGRETENGLLDGPGKLTRALDITLSLNGWNLTGNRELYLIKGKTKPGERIVTAPRVGIKNGTDKLWRFRLRPI